MLTKLYSRTSIGQVQIWFIEVDADRFRTAEGIKNGAITYSNWTVCSPKNVGKANETSAEEQALKEATAKWKKKLESGYFEKEEDIDEVKYFEPMLAHKYNDYKKEVKLPCFVSPKLDGMRCVISRKGMFTRNGKPIVSCPHIFRKLKPIFEKNKDLVFDGELYNHKFKNDFNKIISLCKKTKPTKQDLIESEAYIQYHIFDLVDLKLPKQEYSERLRDLRIITCNLEEDFFVAVDSELIYTENEIELYLKTYIEDGYEGLMLRKCGSIYENKRTKSLLKYKEFQDEEFEIYDIEEGIGNRSGMMGRILLKTKSGKTFESSARGNQSYYIELLKNKQNYIGKLATVRFQNYTPDGVPRFPVCVAIRDYE